MNLWYNLTKLDRIWRSGRNPIYDQGYETLFDYWNISTLHWFFCMNDCLVTNTIHGKVDSIHYATEIFAELMHFTCMFLCHPRWSTYHDMIYKAYKKFHTLGPALELKGNRSMRELGKVTRQSCIGTSSVLKSRPLPRNYIAKDSQGTKYG